TCGLLRSNFSFAIKVLNPFHRLYCLFPTQGARIRAPAPKLSSQLLAISFQLNLASANALN
ncbi:MAG: hypothetical protein ABSD70_16700, partial [Terracidiphilus sp.]